MSAPNPPGRIVSVPHPSPTDTSAARRRARRERDERDGVVFKRILWTFAILMGTNVVTCWVISLALKNGRDEAGRTVDTAVAVATVIDAIVIGVFGFLSRRDFTGGPPRSPMTTPRPVRGIVRDTLWTAVALLAINFAYHAALRVMFGVEAHDTRLGASCGFAFTLLFVCVFPAVMEEFFFRKICHDFFAAHTGPTLAAFASGVMFACAHTLAVVSFPYLAFFGFIAAHLRRRTGTLIAPMAMHFAHNLVISLYERFH